MRNQVITSSVAVVVTRVVDCLAIAGVAVRTFLHHTSMREQFGQWQEPRYEDRNSSNYLASSLGLGLKRLNPSRALAIAPAYAAGPTTVGRG